MRCRECKSTDIKINNNVLFGFCKNCNKIVSFEYGDERDDLCEMQKQLKVYNELENTLRKRIAERGDDYELLTDLMHHLLRRARLQRKPHPENVADLYREILEIMDTVCEAHPESDTTLLSVSITYEAATCLNDAQFPEEALAVSEKALGKIRKKISTDPERAKSYSDLFFMIPKAILFTNDARKVLAMHDEFMRAYETVKKLEPRYLPQPAEYTTVLKAAAQALVRQNKSDEVVSLLVAGYDRLVKEKSNNPFKNLALVNSIFSIAEQFQEAGHNEAAEILMRLSLKIMQNPPESKNKLSDSLLRANMLMKLGECCKKTNKQDEAVESYKEAFYFLAELVGDRHTSKRLTACFTQAYISLTNLFVTYNRTEDAADIHRAYLDATAVIGEEKLTAPVYRLAALKARQELLKIDCNTNDVHTYEQMYNELIAFCRKHIDDVSVRGQFLQTLAILLSDFAQYLLSQDKTQEGAELFRESVAVFEQAHNENNQDLLILHNYINTCYRCGLILDDPHCKAKALSLAKQFRMLPISKKILSEAE